MCREEKKSLTTWYKGILFRSRLEARVVFILDELGINWIYEPEGFELSNELKYLPDFFISFKDGTRQVLEAKGYLDDYDKAKIECFEKDFGVKVLMVDDLLKMNFYGEEKEIYLTGEGLVSDMTDEFRKALEDAKKVVFEDYHRQLKSSCVKDDAASALSDLLVQYLDNHFYLELGGEQPQIRNPIDRDPKKGGGGTPFYILITKSDRKDFDVHWFCGNKKKYSIAVLERQVKRTCRWFWSISNNLLDEPDHDKWTGIKERRINNLIEILRGDEKKDLLLGDGYEETKE